jgi:hypothetical protein
MDSQPEPLLAMTDQFFRSNSGLKYPQALVAAFPRIANQIVKLQNNPDGLRDYFVDLVNSARGNRKGFAFEVLMDIEDLRSSMLGQSGGLPADGGVKWF